VFVPVVGQQALTMNNPNHPLYNALGSNSNAHLLDNMLFTTDPHKQTIIQQYAYPMDSGVHQVGMLLLGVLNAISLPLKPFLT
jgi:hypothetical protein